jgi:hypothetical protein
MRSIIDATQPEQLHGLALKECVNKNSVPAGPHGQPDLTPGACSAFGWT